MSKRTSAHQQTMRVAFCGMITALSVVLMLLGGLMPMLLYAAPMVAGMLLLPVLVEYGRKAAWLTWFATALCMLFLGVDKEAAFFYLFIGYYPVLKWELDRRITAKGWRLAVKLVLFSLSSGVMYLLLSLLFPAQSLMAEFGQAGVWMGMLLVLLMDLCLLLYDRLLVPAVVVYERKIKPVLKFLHR